MPQEVSVWSVITLILLPIAYVALSVLWWLLMRSFGAIDKLRKDMTDEAAKIRAEQAAAQLENERRYVNQSVMAELKADMFRRFDRLEVKIDNLPHKPSAE